MSLSARVEGRNPTIQVTAVAPLARVALSNPTARLVPILPLGALASASTASALAAQAALLPAGSVQVLADSATAELVSGTPLSSHRAVYRRDLDGRAYYASPDEGADEVAGITTTAAGGAGNPVAVRASGLLEDPSFNFVPGPVFLGPSGTLIQSPPSAGAVLQLAVATTPRTLVIRIQQPIYQE